MKNVFEILGVGGGNGVVAIEGVGEWVAVLIDWVDGWSGSWLDYIP